MSIEQSRSFIAELKCEREPLNFRNLDLKTVDIAGLLGRIALAWVSPLAFVATHFLSTKEEEPFLMTRHRNGAPEPGNLLVYFRCYGDYYNIQVRSKHKFGNFLSKHSSGILGAFPAAGGDTTSFNLLDSEGNVVTLDDFENDNVDVYLRARNADIIREMSTRQDDKTWSPYRIFSDKSGDKHALFNLRILERNVPYPTTYATLTAGEITISASS
jgi:hypothetical protein